MTVFKLVDKLILETGEDLALDIAIYGSYMYVLCGGTTVPPRVVEVSLKPFRRTRAVTLPTEAGWGYSLICHGGYIYVLCHLEGAPAKIYKISVDTLSIIDTLTLGSGEEIYSYMIGKIMVLSEDGTHLYIGVTRISSDFRAGVARIDLKTLQETGILWLTEYNNVGMSISGNILYVCSYPGYLGRVVKVDLATFTQVAVHDLSQHLYEPHDCQVVGNYLYVLRWYSLDGVYETGITRLNLETLTAETIPMDASYESWRIIHYFGSLYFTTWSTPSRIVRVKLDEWPNYMVLDVSADAPVGLHGMVASGLYLYVCVRSSPGRILKVQVEEAIPMICGRSEPLDPRVEEKWLHRHHWESGEVNITVAGAEGQKNLGTAVPTGKIRRIKEITVRHTGTNNTVVTLLVAGGATKLSIDVPAQSTRVWSSQDGRIFNEGEQPAVQSSDVTGGSTYVSASGVEE